MQGRTPGGTDEVSRIFHFDPAFPPSPALAQTEELKVGGVPFGGGPAVDGVDQDAGVGEVDDGARHVEQELRQAIGG